MSVLETTPPPAPPAPSTAPAAAARGGRGNPWLPTLRGTALVTEVELRRRRPTKKSMLIFGLLWAALGGLTLLIAAGTASERNAVPMEMMILLVLGAGMLIAPSLAATSINGDSAEGVLAPLQMSRLTPGDLAFGKLIAAWAVTLIALVVTLPFVIYAFGKSQWAATDLLAVLAVVGVEVAVMAAIGLAWSSLAARSAASVAMSHVTTGFLGLGTLLLFLFTQPLVSGMEEVTYRDRPWDTITEEQWNTPGFNPDELECVDVVRTENVVHTERTWWMLLGNPFLVVAETAPLYDPDAKDPVATALPYMHMFVAMNRLGPELSHDFCASYDGLSEAEEQGLTEERYWLPGLLFHVLLGLGAMGIAIRRMRVPYRKLKGGTRVA